MQEPNLTMAKMLAMMDEEINKGYCDLPRAPGRWTPPYRSSAGTSGADAQAAATCQGRPREVVLLDTATGVLRPVRPHRLAASCASETICAALNQVVLVVAPEYPS